MSKEAEKITKVTIKDMKIITKLNDEVSLKVWYGHIAEL